MDPTHSQLALSAPGNCTNHPMLQPSTQSASSVPGTTIPRLGPDYVKSTTHAASTPNHPVLELGTTQTISSVDRTANDPPLVSATSQDVPDTRNH